MTSIQHCYILVGIETDPRRYHGENASRPTLLDRNAAEQVLAHFATDLTAMFPAIRHCSLTMPGALFDQTQILSPGMPIFKALESLHESTNPAGDFEPRLFSIGARKERMPLAEIQPRTDIPLGLLQVLPLLVSGPSNTLGALLEEMEHRFLEQGQLSAHSAKGLESQFRVSINHARFMTITDLNALLRLQLEHYGFLPLWELLDAAINSHTLHLQVVSSAGLKFKWHEGCIHSFFESFDWWAKHGGGADITASKQQLQTGYADWTREYRRYLTMLTAHGVRVSQHLPGHEDSELSDTFLIEESTAIPPADAAPVTEHSADDLGTVVVTVVSADRQMNFYPLLATGLNDLHRHIRNEGYSGDVAFPGNIVYDQDNRQLMADTLPAE
jgi:hypothetical protein